MTNDKPKMFRDKTFSYKSCEIIKNISSRNNASVVAKNFCFATKDSGLLQDRTRSKHLLFLRGGGWSLQEFKKKKTLLHFRVKKITNAKPKMSRDKTFS